MRSTITRCIGIRTDDHVENLDKQHAAQLARSRSYDLINVVDNTDLNRAAALISRAFQMSKVLISLMYDGHLRVVSQGGSSTISFSEPTPFCHYTLLHQQPCEVTDVNRDQRFVLQGKASADNLQLRYCASVPLKTSYGHVIGVLTMLDDKPRTMNSSDRESFHSCATLIISKLNLRRQVGRTDPVSGLPNRQQFYADLAVLDIGPAHLAFGCIIEVFDLQSTNCLTQSKGALPFESLIYQAAERVRLHLPDKVELYHVAVARFAFIIDQMTHEDLVSYLASLSATLTEPFYAEGLYLRACCRTGVVPFCSADHRDVLRRAVVAIQNAVDNERPWAYYDPMYDALVQRRSCLASDAPQALRHDQFYLLYQPRIDFGPDQSVRVEALLRWRHPDYGELFPSEFVPIIERTALMPEVTSWVLDRVLAQLARWQQRGFRCIVSINVSATDFVDGELPHRVASACMQHQISATQVELEVTEGEWMGGARSAYEQLTALQAFGVAIYIDDFGSGFSNFGYLSRLPLTGFKIDRELVMGAERNAKKTAILTALVQLAHALGVRLIAEGVETKEQMHLLHRLGFNEGQGFYFSFPLDASQVEQAWRQGLFKSLATLERVGQIC